MMIWFEARTAIRPMVAERMALVVVLGYLAIAAAMVVVAVLPKKKEKNKQRS